MDRNRAPWRWPASFFGQNYRRLINAVFALIDMATVFMSVMTAFSLTSGLHDPGGALVDSEVRELSLLAAVFGLVIFERIGLYRHEPSLLRLIEIRKISQGSFILGMVLIAYAFYADIQSAQRPLLFATLLLFSLMMIGRAMVFKFQEWLHARRFHVRRAVVVGADDTGRMLYKHIKEAPQLGYWVAGFYDDSPANLRTTERWLSPSRPREGPLLIADEQTLAAVLRKEKIELLLISKPMGVIGEAQFKRLLNLTRDLPVIICFMPYFSGYFAWQVRLVDFNGFPMVSLGKGGARAGGGMIKRLIDLVVAACGLLLLMPALAAIGYAIRKDSPGPILFSQERVGLDGKHFTMYKFRTMFMDVPRYGYTPMQADDPRITRVGRFLRRTSLDELPQLFNVLNGTMSLVGPRPEMPFIVENEYDDFLRERLRAKPGITGVWQISADRNRQIHEDISYDLFYIENQSLLLDLIILVRTVLFGVTAMRTF